MEKKRLIWADSLKGWLIILVVLGHAIQVSMVSTFESNHLWNLIYSFHMPAFIAVSGFFAFRPNVVVGGGKFLYISVGQKVQTVNDTFLYMDFSVIGVKYRSLMEYYKDLLFETS